MSLQKNAITRFYVLDAFRGLAALLVLAYHMPNLSIFTDNIFIKNSDVFVDLFFILSGFVIYHNYKGKLQNFSNSKQFLLKRFKRLIPLHVFTLLMMLLLELSKYPLKNIFLLNSEPFKHNTISAFFTQLFLLNSTPLFIDYNWNGVNWSISAEMITYILFALVSILWCNNKLRTITISISIIVLGFLFFYINYNTLNIIADWNFSFIRAFIGFFMGVLVYIVRSFFIKSKKWNIPYNLIEISTILIVIFVVYNTNYRMHYYIIEFAFCILILTFSMEKGIVSKILKLSVFQKLGLWSYSIYLNHIVVLVIFDVFLKKIYKPQQQYLIVLIELFIIFIVCFYSSYTYKYIEKRFYAKR